MCWCLTAAAAASASPRRATAGVPLETAKSRFSCAGKRARGWSWESISRKVAKAVVQLSRLGVACRAALPVSVPVSSICKKSNVDLL